MKNHTVMHLKRLIFGCFFSIIGLFGLVAPTLNQAAVYADEPTAEVVVDTNEEHVEESENTEATEAVQEVKGSGQTCEQTLGAIGWLVCPSTGKIAEAVDWLYKTISEYLVVNPVRAENGSPIYEVWKYARGITNIVFIIFLLIVIYSQITGVGISNYGVKKALPKLIVAAILMNLSFTICSLAVDASNVIGSGLRGAFSGIEEATLSSMSIDPNLNASMGDIYGAAAGGTALAIAGGVIAFEAGVLWMLIPTILGAIVAVVSGLITIAMRQAVVALLIMIAPLAIVAYILPNTEDLFNKWKKLLTKMLVFYPVFSLLFGASHLAGWAIIASAKDGFGLLLGVAVQIFPLFFSWKLMSMSGTFLGDINTKIRALAAKPLAANRAWAESHRDLTKARTLASNRYTPYARLTAFLADRKIVREEETAEHKNVAKLRGQAMAANRNYRKNGTPSKEGEEAYELQARGMEYQRYIDRHKNNMNKGLGQLEVVKKNASAGQRKRLDKLDMANVKAADALAIEKARAEKIEFDNAEGRYKRFEAAMNAHMDSEHGHEYQKDKYGNFVLKDGERIDLGVNGKYRFHYDVNNAADMAKYQSDLQVYKNMLGAMDGNPLDVQYVNAYAANSYDTQMKSIMGKFQKYFELTPPTKDVVYRLQEFSKMQNAKAAESIDTIIAGLRVLNQRGDTDLVKSIMDDILDEKYGGLELGTHASQALASFLMFEVKNADPFLRRFGKYINLETANAYNENNRQEKKVTYDEYVKGYYERDGKKYYSKKDMRVLMEGTSLDDIERTAFDNLDDSLKKVYGYDPNNQDKKWDLDGYLKRRKQIQTAIEPQFLSALGKWLSGSEQMNSAVKFWTGYSLKMKKDANGNIIVDDKKDPVFDLSAVWNDDAFKMFSDEDRLKLSTYFTDKTADLVKDQTPAQILGARTDLKGPLVNHMKEFFLRKTDDETGTGQNRKQYEADIEAIKKKHANDDISKRDENIKKDINKLDMSLAKRSYQEILLGNGNLAQIFTTRHSGTAINAKPWNRELLGLEDDDALRKLITDYQESTGKHAIDETAAKQQLGTLFTIADTRLFSNEIKKVYDDSVKTRGVSATEFFNETSGMIDGWVGNNSKISQEYNDYLKNYPNATASEMRDKLLEILGDLDNYPGA